MCQGNSLEQLRISQAKALEERCPHAYSSLPDGNGPDMCDINDNICLLEGEETNSCDICISIREERAAEWRLANNANL